MSSNAPQYFRPRDWASAHKVLARPDLDAVPLLISPRPVALTEASAGAWVDLSQLDIAYIKTDGARLHLGALTTMQDLYLSELVNAQVGGILSKAAYLSATLGLRNLASVAGAITAHSGPPEVLLTLLALDAYLVIQGPDLNQRQILLSEYLEGGKKNLARGEVLVEVFFDEMGTNGVGSSLERVARSPRDNAIVAAAAVVKTSANAVETLRLACAGASPKPQRLPEVEKLFIGQSLSDLLLQKATEWVSERVVPVADYRGSVEYRRCAAAILCGRAVKNAWKQSQGG